MEEFELTDEMKSAIDVAKNGNFNAFDEEADELDRDPAYDVFMKDVMDELKGLLPEDYDYYKVYWAIHNYTHS